MNTMTIKELFDVGVSFEASVGEGTKAERLRVPKNLSRLQLDESLINDISSISDEINFLISGEIWCPDFQLNAMVVNTFCTINPNFNMSVISMARGKKFLTPILEIDEFKAPLILALDKDFNILGSFDERPVIVKSQNFDDIKLDYYKGKYLSDTAHDIFDMIKK